MISSLFILQIVLAIFITILVLLQKNSGGGLVNYSSSNESVFGAKGPAGFLAKLTLFFGALFLANTIALSYLNTKNSQKSVTDLLPQNLQAPQIPNTTKEEK